jgi:hypothetical protein
MTRNAMRVLGLFCALGLAAVRGQSQTPSTSAIAGRVTAGGTPLASVSIEARSPSLPGAREQLTAADGSFRLALLPPGEYTLVATRSGFGSVTYRAVKIMVGQTATLAVELQPSASEVISVEGAVSDVDVTSTVAGINVSAAAVEALPLRRDYTDVATMAPGVGADARGLTFYGSTGLENSYVIEDVNVTGIQIGDTRKGLSLSFVDEVQVLTGGLPAEYGRTTGGIINGVIKSGSNDLRGSAFGFSSGGALRAAPAYLAELPSTLREYTRVESEFDYGAEAGGRIVRDRLWLFAGVDRSSRRQNRVLLLPLSVSGFSLATGDRIPFRIDRNLAVGKLTFAAGTHHLFSLSVISDGGQSDGAVRTVQGPPTTWQGTEKSGGHDLSGRLSAIYGARWTVDAMVGRHVETSDFGGAGENIPRFIDNSVSPQVVSGGFGQFFEYYGDRFVRRGDVTLAAASHLLKLGADYARAEERSVTFYSGGDRIFAFCSAALVSGRCPATTYYEHTWWVDELERGFVPSDPSTFQSSFVHPYRNRVSSVSTSAYLQDTWTGERFTINAGVRVERQPIYGRGDKERFVVSNVAPRVGVTWRPTGPSNQKFYAYGGRFYYYLPVYLAYGGSAYQVRAVNLDPTAGNFTPDDRAPAYGNGTRYLVTGAGRYPDVDRDLEGESLDEFLAGYDVSLQGVVVGVKATHRRSGRVIEAFRVNNVLTYANRGYGVGSVLRTLAGDPMEAPKPTRRFNGVELHAAKRYSRGSQLFASYLWSRLYGDYEGIVEQSTGAIAPGGEHFVDYVVNSYGPLYSDRTHQVKVAASYRFDRGIETGLVTHWYSGAPLTANGLSRRTFTNAYFLTPRGALGRGPSDYEADVHLGYRLTLAGMTGTLFVDALNVLNRQAATTLDLAYNTFADGTCGGVPAEICNGDGGIRAAPGTADPVGAVADPRATAPNPHFLRGQTFTGSRAVRLGVRLAF